MLLLETGRKIIERSDYIEAWMVKKRKILENEGIETGKKNRTKLQ